MKWPTLALLFAAIVPLATAAQGTPELTGIYRGEHMITMRGCPGTCHAGSELILGTGVSHSPWIWNFDESSVQITGTTLTVGFDYEVQSVGNLGSDEQRLTAYFTDNGDGTYTVEHGFQIFNPNVGNPRADTTTKFRITRRADNQNVVDIETLDDEIRGEPDGIPGTQIVGVFPMTVQPEFRGSARLDGSSSGGDGISDQLKEALGLNPDAPGADTDGDGLSDAQEIGPDVNHAADGDGDGLIDALEPGDAANDGSRLAGLALLDGIPGRTQSDDSFVGTTVIANTTGGWSFTGAQTGRLELAADAATVIPDTTLGDPGLAYRRGYIQLRLRADDATAATAVLRLTYDADLPAADRLLLYVTTFVTGKERYVLVPASEYRRIDDHTLEVSVLDGGSHDLDSSDGFIRTGFAPAENTLGGYDESSHSGAGTFGLHWLSVLALLIALRVLVARNRYIHRAK